MKERLKEREAFVLEQPALPLHPAAKARQVAIRADDAVTGHDDGDGVLPVRGTDGAGAVGRADPTGQLAIRERGAEGDLGQRPPDLDLKRRPQEVEGKIEDG